MIQLELLRRVGRALYVRAWLFQLCAYPADIRRKRPKELIPALTCGSLPKIPTYRGNLRFL